MRKIGYGHILILIIILTFVAFPLAGAAEAFLIARTDLPGEIGLWVGGICFLLAIPLFIVLLYSLRQSRK